MTDLGITHPAAKIHDEICQKAEWRARLLVDIVSNKFDMETVMDLIEAGLVQAYHEGMKDAEDVCRSVADQASQREPRRIAGVLADSIAELSRRNRNVHKDGH